MSLGHDFYFIAAQPLRGNRNVGAWLKGVRYDYLAYAFDKGLRKVADEVRLPPDRIYTLLPVGETQAAAAASAEHQRAASEVWMQHEGSLAQVLGHVVGLLAESHLGLEGSGVGDFIAHIGGGFVRDARLAEPMKNLSASLGTYDQRLRQCVHILNSDPSLQQAHARARRRRALIWVSILGTSMVMLAGLIACFIVDTQPTPSVPPANSVVVVPPEIPVAPPTPPSATAATAVRPKARPVAPAPRSPVGSTGTGSAVAPPLPPAPSRTACLRACVGKCQDDPDCERSCAGGCPR